MVTHAVPTRLRTVAVNKPDACSVCYPMTLSSFLTHGHGPSCRRTACFIARPFLVCMIALLSVGLTCVVAGEAPARWSWQEPHCKVLPTGDLEWAPQPFVFKAGEAVRYIDFDSGNDARDGQ